MKYTDARIRRDFMNPKTLRNNIKFMTLTALGIALTFVATAFINLRLPIVANGGLIHLGNVVLFVMAALFGKKVGAISAGVGMALFDLMGGWVLWSPFTLVIVGLMGFVVGLIGEKKKSVIWFVVSVIAAMAIKIAGYYVAEGIIYGNWIAPATSIPGNIVQVTVGAVIAFPVIAVVRRVVKREAFYEV